MAEKKRGRPSSFTQRKADEICRRIADGESLRSICLRDGMPTRMTVRKWMRDRKEFLDQYTRARDDQAETFVDEIMDIAEGVEDPQRARLMIDARKWAAGKMKPKKYGDKIDHNVTGDMSLTVVTGVPERDGVDDDEA